MLRNEDIFIIDKVVRGGLIEDRAFNDITTRSTVAPEKKSSAFVFAKQDFVVSGIVIFERCFNILDPNIRIFSPFRDGAFIQKGTKLITISGFTASILSAERVALNFLAHLSGIATYTKKMADILQGTKIKLLDTRKTLPGLRVFEKWAVKHGGGFNHRFNLESGILIKENHISAIGSIAETISRVRESIPPAYTIEVEVRNLDEAREAIESRADIILIDNLSGNELKEVVDYAHGKVLIEVSGGIDLRNIHEYRDLKIDFLSSSSLIMKSTAVDISLLLEEADGS